jgi:DNA polymerase (family X)
VSPTGPLDRAAIVARLREIAALLELRGGNRFKARAFERGARALEGSREAVAVLVAEERLRDLPGIGFAIAGQITELHRTGTSQLLETLREGLPSGVLELSQVPGIGLHALKTLSGELGIATVDDLRARVEEGRLREASGFGPKREARIREGLRRYGEEKPRILLANGLRLGRAILRELEELPGVSSATIAGTLRRSVELSSRIVVVVGAEDPESTLERLVHLPRVASIVTRESRVARVRLADGTPVEAIVASPDAEATALFYATGSEAHVARVEARATAGGLALTRDGLFCGESRRATPDEDAVFRAVGLHPVPPELREGGEEVDAAAQGPFALITEGDLRGFVHCHSTWSDGKDTIEAMARAAKARGAEFITITDHSANAHYAGGLDVERLLRQWEEIDEVEARVGIRILKGTEADILADGALDWPDRILEQLDVVVASIHQRYRQDEDAMTRRLLRAMRHPLFKIWGHPLGRLVTSRPPVACRLPEILDALAESRGAIEINGDPHRLDLEPRWCKEAAKRGIRFVLSVDAHATRELENTTYAVGLARRAGLRRDDVLNALAPADFARAVRPAREIAPAPRRRRAPNPRPRL